MKLKSIIYTCTVSFALLLSSQTFAEGLADRLGEQIPFTSTIEAKAMHDAHGSKKYMSREMADVKMSEHQAKKEAMESKKMMMETSHKQ